MITVEHLTRRFGPVRAVDRISFHVEKGEIVGFLGPNGAGKTTTMRILTGFLPASSGSVRVAGHDVLRQSMEVRRRTGYLPEAVPLYREHRVREMLEFQAQLHRMPRAVSRKRIPEVLDRVGILDRERQLVGRLSRGLRQRVGIAVALLPHPEVLILDEPTSGLDPLQRIEVRRLISELSGEHTVLVSSHILPEIEAVCPRLIIMNQGRIAADGKRDDLVRALGSKSHVRIEAVVGAPADGGAAVAEAVRLLGSLPGVGEVADRGRLGIHQGFDVFCDEDLREDVGALASQRGWALRELSYQQPSLEELFARIALGLDEDAPIGDGTGDAGPTSAAAPEGPVALEVSLPGSSQAGSPQAGSPQAGPEAAAGDASPASPGKIVYNLNPFDEGANRDLGAPKPIDGPGPPPGRSGKAEEAGDDA